MSIQESDVTFVKRKASPALLTWRERGVLLYEYLKCYTLDERFVKGLLSFYDETN